MTFNNFTLTAVLFLLFTQVSSQDFNGGLLCGLTASQIDGDSQSGYHKAGLYAGAYVQRPLNDDFSAQLEMRFAQKGAYNRLNESKLAMSYIEVPLLGQYQKWGFVFEAGFVPGILLRAKTISDVFGEYDSESFNRYSIDVAFGVNYLFAKRIGASARMAYSVLPIASISNTYTTRSQYHNVLNFGFFFVLK